MPALADEAFDRVALAQNEARRQAPCQDLGRASGHAAVRGNGIASVERQRRAIFGRGGRPGCVAHFPSTLPASQYTSARRALRDCRKRRAGHPARDCALGRKTAGRAALARAAAYDKLIAEAVRACE
jgi:hypothetical protein